MSALDPQTTERLAKLCGMFGSDHAGERAAAAAKAHELIRALQLTWADVLSSSNSTSTQPETLADKLALLRDHPALTKWELDFVQSVGLFKRVSAKQLAIIDGLVEKVREAVS